MTQHNRETLLALIERAEKATAESFELFVVAFGHIHGGQSVAAPVGARFHALLDVGAWLDAAMSLVPEGWGRCIEQERPTCACEASLSPPGSEPWGPGSVDGEGSTLALALVSAALRARARATLDPTGEKA